MPLIACKKCMGTGHVCKDHPHLAWGPMVSDVDHPRKGACYCGAAGEPCMECKTFVTVTPQDVFKPKFDEREFGIHLKHATDKVKLVVEAARKFVKSADEFFPEYPSGVTEPLDALVEAVNALGD